jgi:transcription elongation factor/antiterminator RfaH
MDSEMMQHEKINDTGYLTQSLCSNHVSLNREWYALYVKSRHEFTTEEELKRRGIETYLPSVTRVRQWSDRKKQVISPLFPGYLFVSIFPNPEEYLRVLKTRGAVTFISLQPGYPTSVSPEEIQSLKMLIESGEEIDIYPHFKEGERVRIKRGPLTGAEGVLKKKEDRYYFLVNIELLGRSVGINVQGDEIEAA